MKLNQVIYGDNREKLKEYPDNFFDGTVTDPPYGISFMGQNWDTFNSQMNGRKQFQQLFYEIAIEMLRVAKPRSFLFCFGGTRTYHRVTCAIEDAGWIIRDQIQWLYGQGFPKSANISKRIDKEAGAKREVIGKVNRGHQDMRGGSYNSQNAKNNPHRFVDVTIPATELAKQWDGYGTGLKPGWEPIIVAMKPLEKGLTYAQNAEKWGVVGLNIDGGRIPTNEDTSRERNIAIKGGNYIAGRFETDGVMAGGHPQGRWPANVILSHSPDCVCVGTKKIGKGETRVTTVKNAKSSWKNSSKDIEHIKYGEETVEVWACVSDCPVRMLEGQKRNIAVLLLCKSKQSRERRGVKRIHRVY